MTQGLLIWLRGDPLDLGLLHRFVECQDLSVLLENERYAIRLKNGNLPQTFDIAVERAKTLTTILNGIFGALYGQFSNLEVDEVEMIDENGIRHRDNFLYPVPIIGRSRATVTFGDETEQRAKLCGWIDSARANSRVEDALRFWAMQREWYNLHKVWEIIRDDVGGGLPGLVATGWVSADDAESFRSTSNDYRTLGDAARHARTAGPSSPATPIDLDRAEEIVGDVLRGWLDTNPR